MDSNSYRSLNNPSARDDIDKTMRRFTQDEYIKVFFAKKDLDDDEKIEPLRIISKWMLTEVPHHISCRVGNF